MRASTPMSARPRRSAWGFAITDRNDWRIKAACRNVDPDLFFTSSRRPVALHICERHCDVKAQCQEQALADRPVGCVQGGIAWRCATTNKSGRGDPVGYNTKPASRCELCTVDGGQR